MREFVGMKKFDSESVKNSESILENAKNTKLETEEMSENLKKEIEKADKIVKSDLEAFAKIISEFEERIKKDVFEKTADQIKQMRRKINALTKEVEIYEKATHIRTSRWIIESEEDEERKIYTCEFCGTRKPVGNPTIELTRYCEICGAYMHKENDDA